MQKMKPYLSWQIWSCCTSHKLDIKTILQAITEFPIVHKDGIRSYVCQGELSGKQVVAKQPRDKHRRIWARILSLFLSGESRRTFDSLVQFKQNGIASVEPLYVLEKRRFGVIVDSWLLYEYREGRVSNKKDLPKIVEILQKLHAVGFRHMDPVLNNFMIAPNGELFLIDCSGRLRVGYFSDFYDFMMLARLNKGKGVKKKHLERLEPFTLDCLRKRVGYRLAKIYLTYKKRRAKLKQNRKRIRNRDAQSYRK